jgi:sigma-54 specific flagellar transcriptional regulator A
LSEEILLITADENQAEEIGTILDFLEQPFRVAKTVAWNQVAPKQDDLLAVFVGNGRGDAHRAQMVCAVRDELPDVPALVLHTGDVPELDGVKAGDVSGYIQMPARFPQLSSMLERLRDQRTRQRKRTKTKQIPGLVGRSPAMLAVRRLIEQVATTDASVLILGESGTGKEVVARSVHQMSIRQEKLFVPINCGAIPADLLESELFGHEKGAFTGAITARQGRFEMAEGGTLFLDEIGDMSLSMQVKLLRVLQEKTFERVGANKSFRADVRVIAATHRDLENSVEEEKFREDLFYRLNVFPIEMPALRKRTEDIPLLMEEFFRRLEAQGRDSVQLTEAAMASLMAYDWPGNVRELGNLVERLVILYPGETVDLPQLPEKYQAEGIAPSLAQLPRSDELLDDSEAEVFDGVFGHVTLPKAGFDLKEHLAELEIRLIQKALDESGNVVAQAARRLNIRRTTLVEKLRKYGIAKYDEATGS